MRHLLFILLSLNFFTLTLSAVDATLTIEKDVEHRSHIALMDGSAEQNQRVFNIFLSDLKISGHFLPEGVHNQGDFSSNFIAPGLKSQEYVLKYTMNLGSGAKLTVRLLKASDGTELFKKKLFYTRHKQDAIPDT